MFNIEQFLIQNKIEYRTEGKNVSKGEYSICCLYCTEGRYHCGINPKKGFFHCWICSEKGNITKLVSKLKGISYTEAKGIVNPQNDLKKVLDGRNNKMIQIIEEPIKNKIFRLPEYTKPFIKDSTNVWQTVSHRFLIDKYNLSWDEILEADLHYCYYGDKYKNCIIIPIYFDRKMVNFVARCWVKNSKKRYINCSNEESLVKTKNLIYNKDSIKIGQNLVIIVEGCFDAIKAGLDRTVALFGTEVTQEQLNHLVSLQAKELIIMLDSDPHLTTTDKKANDLTNYLSAFTKTKVVKLPYGKDPADLSKKEIDKLIC